MKNFFRINNKYIQSFRNNVYSRFVKNDKKTDSIFLKCIFDEIFTLFRRIGNRLADKHSIQQEMQYPDSKKYNELITDIGIDIDKLYTSHKLIESDLDNLLKYNSYQRNQIEKKVFNIQQDIYGIASLNKHDIFSTEYVELFEYSNSIGSESKGVFVDENRKILTLQSVTTTVRPIDTENTFIYFNGTQSKSPLYPNNIMLSPGSHWKKESTDPHLIDNNDLSMVNNYKYMLIDEHSNTEGVGICEFEAVDTFNPSLSMLSNYLTKATKKKKVYIDLNNSLQGKYIRSKIDPYFTTNQTFKLVIPFNDQVFTNEIIIEFTPTSDGFSPPIINWSQSKIFSSINGGEQSYNFIPIKPSKDGKYSCMTYQFIIPSRMELIISYNTPQLMWHNFDYYMSHYTYMQNSSYNAPELGGASLILSSDYDLYVDTEYNKLDEQKRAINILKIVGK